LYRPLMTRPIMSPLMRLTPPERLLLAAIIHHSATNVIAIFLLSELFNLFLIYDICKQQGEDQPGSLPLQTSLLHPYEETDWMAKESWHGYCIL
jgi:hypothetical protein